VLCPGAQPLTPLSDFEGPLAPAEGTAPAVALSAGPSVPSKAGPDFPRRCAPPPLRPPSLAPFSRSETCIRDAARRESIALPVLPCLRTPTLPTLRTPPRPSQRNEETCGSGRGRGGQGILTLFAAHRGTPVPSMGSDVVVTLSSLPSACPPRPMRPAEWGQLRQLVRKQKLAGVRNVTTISKGFARGRGRIGAAYRRCRASFLPSPRRSLRAENNPSFVGSRRPTPEDISRGHVWTPRWLTSASRKWPDMVIGHFAQKL